MQKYGSIKLLIISVIFTLVVFSIHLIGQPNSMLNYNDFLLDPKCDCLQNSYLESTIQFHETEFTYSKRQVLTFLLNNVSMITGISKSILFVLSNFLFMTLTGFVVMKIAERLYMNPVIVVNSGVLFFLSFPVLFAFFPPVYVFDDITQWLMVAVSILFLQRGKFWLFVITFFFAVITRETTLVLIPLVVMFVPESMPKRNFWISIVVICSLIGALRFFQDSGHAYLENVNKRVLNSGFNFNGANRIIESLYSFLVIFLLPSILHFKSRNQLGVKEKKLLQIFWGVFLINSTLVFLFGYARETRLFFLPLVPVIPFLTYILSLEVKNFKMWLFNLKQKNRLVFIATILSVTPLIFIGVNFYHTTIGWTSERFFKLYFFLYFLCCVFILLFGLFSKSGIQKKS